MLEYFSAPFLSLSLHLPSSLATPLVLSWGHFGFQPLTRWCLVTVRILFNQNNVLLSFTHSQTNKTIYSPKRPPHAKKENKDWMEINCSPPSYPSSLSSLEATLCSFLRPHSEYFSKLTMGIKRKHLTKTKTTAKTETNAKKTKTKPDSRLYSWFEGQCLSI